MYQDHEEDPVHELVHLYIDGAFGRRELISRVTRMLGSGAAAAVALGGYSELLAQAPQACPEGIKVPLDAPDIVARDVEFSGAASTIFAHFAYPKNITGKQPGVIVVHENQGLTDHIKDVCRRVARAGFVAVAPDLLSRQGGIQQFPDAAQRQAAYGRTNQLDRRLDLVAALDYLKFTPFVQFDRIGIVGFCAGGGNIWDFVTNIDELAAAVPFYGPPPPVDTVQRVQTPMMLLYGGTDRALTANMGPIMQEMLVRQKNFGFRVYEGAAHAFHNDTGAAYNATAACDAWGITINFFNTWLRKA